MNESPPQIVLCNGADLPRHLEQFEPLILEYRDIDEGLQNVNLKLPDFICDVFYLSDRILDLLEIASFVYSADRLTTRGNKDNLELHSWARNFIFVIKVRDYSFWNNSNLKEKLKNALEFMSGDKTYHFSFQPGHSTPPTSLFDNEKFQIEPKKDTKVILFSGGLDSLAGIVECLEKSDNELYLISHRSSPGRMTRTRKQLLRELKRTFDGRIKSYEFSCSLRKVRAKEETQRTRIFLRNK